MNVQFYLYNLVYITVHLVADTISFMMGIYAKLYKNLLLLVLPHMVSLTVYGAHDLCWGMMVAVMSYTVFWSWKMFCCAGFVAIYGFSLNRIILLLELHILLPSSWTWTFLLIRIYGRSSRQRHQFFKVFLYLPIYFYLLSSNSVGFILFWNGSFISSG